MRAVCLYLRRILTIKNIANNCDLVPTKKVISLAYSAHELISLSYSTQIVCISQQPNVKATLLVAQKDYTSLWIIAEEETISDPLSFSIEIWLTEKQSKKFGLL